MIGAFAYLTFFSARNRLIQKLQRLKNPRYAIALLLGLGYFWTIYFNPSWGEASMYFLMALVLLLRPRGLFGERIEKFE